MQGSLGWAIIKFLESGKWKNRAPDTRRNQRPILDHLRETYGPGLLIHLDHRTVKGIHKQITKAFSTSTADIALGLLSAVWKYADRFLEVDLSANPTRDVARVHESTKEHEPWPTDVIEAFDKAAPATIRLARLLAYYTGQRRLDLVQMDWARFNGERIEVVCQSKSGGYLSIPCHPALLAALLPIRKQSGPIIAAHGRPYTANSLSNAFRKIFRQIGVDGYSVHGLRKNAAVALAEVGCEPHEIMAITGHKTLAMVTHYTKRANQKLLADRAMEKWKTAKSG